MATFGFEALTTVPGGLNYLGTWNAATNTPTITSSVGTPGDYYIVDVPGTTNIDGINDWGIGDWIIFSTSGVWQKIDNSEVVAATIYNSDGTVTGTRIVDLNGNTIKFDDGSLGINTTPSTALHVNALAVPAGEAVARFGVTDSSGYVQIANGTGTNNVFAPLLQGRQLGTSLHSAIGTEGIIDPVDDTGTTPITLFKARLSNFTSPVTRPLFQFTSWTFDLMTMLANGNVGIGTATPTEKLDVAGKTKTTTFQMTTTPTAGYVLTSDASGNGSWQTPPVTSGVFGIANTSGVYTFYSTLTLAMTAAVAGQTIEMFADVTETGNVTITLKDGVNINGNGHTYTHSYAAGNSNTFQNISGAISCVISNLRVIRSGRANGTTGDYVFNATVNDSQFFFNGVFMESTYGNSVYLFGTTFQYKPHSGNLYAKAFLTAITTQGSITGFKGQSTSSGKGIYGLGGVIDKCTGMSISGDGINGTCNNSYGFSTSGIALAGSCYNSYGNSITYRAGDGNLFYNCVLISSSGFAASNGAYKNCTLISASGNAAGPYLLNKHDNCYLESTSNVVVVGPYTGEFRNCTVVSLWNNAGGHAFTIANGSIITNSHIKVENASANCINFGSAVTIKYASNVFAGATTPVNANITQGVINTEDNQGNILL